MANSSTKTFKASILQPHLPDDVSVRRWFAFYGLFFAALACPLAVLVVQAGWSWSDWASSPAETFAKTSVGIKLLGFALYLSLCCTFLPLPTGWIVAGVATREAALAGSASESILVVAALTTLTVAVVGAAGSTVANLNDYHLFTWILRHHRIAAVRKTRSYQAAARWFSGSPFFLLVLFNFIPIPVDLIRMLATSHRYPRVPFAAANFLGRFVRYGVIALVTYWWDLGWIAPAVLLALAAVLGLGRVGPKFVRKLFTRRTNRHNEDLSDIHPAEKEQ